MGFMSWETADTHQSIPNMHASHENANKAFYLLLPNNTSRKVSYYNGYGQMLGRSAYCFVMEFNFTAEQLSIMDDDDERLEMMGMMLLTGEYFETNEGVKYVYGENCTDLNALLGENMISVDYGWEKITINGVSTNMEGHEELGNVKSKKLSSFIKFHLKFSYSPDALYSELKASKICTKQGFFY
ncbi:hypothetical protein [Aliivibrio fischeri]|uniref:hypothetical protein n=1 Tax=Aliivibrio fischeri TaxID=668 RepID=UPI0012D91BCC|nr:hypothetical protein [Aliivibrio fischeri]MUJ20327.1 hypothetical protein [Aliivibrio fischeri]